MRKFIIDTDTGSDDAVALLMALNSPQIQLLACTTVFGNVPLEQATKNCIATCEVVGKIPPVYMGADKPLFRNYHPSSHVHGLDGMGDKELIHPVAKPVSGTLACDAILQLVSQHPGEIELAVLGPATNIALAILKDRQTMMKCKHIWSMGTSGFGVGNSSPVAEANVYCDAESYEIMLNLGVPITIAGFDVCFGESSLNKEQLAYLAQSGNKVAKFAVDCTSGLLAFNLRTNGMHIVDPCDAVAFGCALWDDVVWEPVDCVARVCTNQNDPAYGQVIFYYGNFLKDTDGFGRPFDLNLGRCTVVKSMNNSLFKDRLMNLLLS